METNSEYTDIGVLKHQREFVLSRDRHTGLVAGFGAGKSLAATVKTVAMKMEYPGIDVAYYLPTYGLVKSIAVPNVTAMLNSMEINFRYHETDHEFTTPFGKIILRSMANPENIVGYEVGYSIIDETDLIPNKKMKKTFVKILARNRTKLPDGKDNMVDMVSTPEGFNFMYDFFVKDRKDGDGRRLIRAKTMDNPFLPTGYISSLKDVYTAEEIDAYLSGEFVNLTAGTVHHKFDRKKNHSDRSITAKDVLHIGMDFNVTNMNAILHVIDYVKFKESNVLVTAADEVVKAYDTADMISILKERYPKHQKVVYPDASGNNRNTAATDTDIGLLRKAGFKVRVNGKNPSVKSRITAVNSGFLNAHGESSYMVNTHKCPSFTEALEKMPYKNGQPDKESGYDHLCEAGGYAFYKIRITKSVGRLSAG